MAQTPKVGRKEKVEVVDLLSSDEDANDDDDDVVELVAGPRPGFQSASSLLQSARKGFSPPQPPPPEKQPTQTPKPLSQSTPKRQTSPPITHRQPEFVLDSPSSSVGESGVRCCFLCAKESTSPLLQCSICDLAVHVICYDILPPECPSTWRCRDCFSPNEAIPVTNSLSCPTRPSVKSPPSPSISASHSRTQPEQRRITREQQPMVWNKTRFSAPRSTMDLEVKEDQVPAKRISKAWADTGRKTTSTKKTPELIKQNMKRKAAKLTEDDPLARLRAVLSSGAAKKKKDSLGVGKSRAIRMLQAAGGSTRQLSSGALSLPRTSMLKKSQFGVVDSSGRRSKPTSKQRLSNGTNLSYEQQSAMFGENDYDPFEGLSQWEGNGFVSFGGD